MFRSNNNINISHVTAAIITAFHGWRECERVVNGVQMESLTIVAQGKAVQLEQIALCALNKHGIDSNE